MDHNFDGYLPIVTIAIAAGMVTIATIIVIVQKRRFRPHSNLLSRSNNANDSNNSNNSNNSNKSNNSNNSNNSSNNSCYK